MHILQVIEPLEGGAWVHVLDLVRELRARGDEVAVAAPGDPLRLAPLADVGARVHTIDLVPEMFAGRSNLQGLRQLHSLMRDGAYDVVHLHDLKAGAIGRVAARAAGLPAVFTPHGFAHRNQHLRERGGAAARRLVTLNIERALAPLTRRIVCVCEDERRAALADRIAPADRFAVVPLGVADGAGAQPDPELAKLPGEGPLIGFMTRLVARKGVRVLLDALVLLRERAALPRVALIGNGDLAGEVRARVAAEGLSERVHVRPFAPPVWPQLAAFDLFVLPTLWDVFPIAVLEAMAARLPVIASDVHGLPESVDDGVTGLLVPAGNAPALADAIARLAHDAGLRTRMGAAARERYEQHFRPAVMTDALQAIYAAAAC